MPAVSELDIGGRKVRVTNLGKVLYPASGFTKAQVIDYYARIADVLLPHLLRRPVTLKRYPDGVDAEFFYEKNAPAHRPPWLKTAPVWSDTRGGDIDYCLLNDRAAAHGASAIAAGVVSEFEGWRFTFPARPRARACRREGRERPAVAAHRHRSIPRNALARPAAARPRCSARVPPW